MDFKQEVKSLIDKALEENPTLFLISYHITPNYEIKVVLDGDNGVNVEDCVTISRAIEHNLDREKQDFSLEVTSCGIFADLVQERQYKKNIGREISVKTEKETLEGELISVENNQITIKTTTKEPKPVGKGKILVTKEHIFMLSDIKQANLVLKF